MQLNPWVLFYLFKYASTLCHWSFFYIFISLFPCLYILNFPSSSSFFKCGISLSVFVLYFSLISLRGCCSVFLPHSVSVSLSDVLCAGAELKNFNPSTFISQSGLCVTILAWLFFPSFFNRTNFIRVVLAGQECVNWDWPRARLSLSGREIMKPFHISISLIKSRLSAGWSTHTHTHKYRHGADTCVHKLSWEHRRTLQPWLWAHSVTADWPELRVTAKLCQASN